MIADVIAVIGSTDVVMGDVDRWSLSRCERAQRV